MRLTHIRSLIPMVALLAIWSQRSPVYARAPEDAINRQIQARIAAGIKAHGHAFDGPDIIHPAIMKAIEGKRLVGLGEGSHGTSEIQSFYGNLILAMAKKGRVLFFLEDPYAGTASVNQWVQGDGAEGDLTKRMVGLYRIHQTQEFENFFRAARQLNATAPDGRKIEIYGIDTVLAPGPGDVTPALKAFSAANGLDLNAQITLCATYINDPKTQDPKSRARFADASAQIQLAVSRLPASTPGQTEAAVMANALVHYIQMEFAYNNVFSSIQVGTEISDSPTSTITNGIRDAGMAENIKILMDSKIPTSGVAVYWAHNSHVGRISMLDADPTGFLSTWGNTGCLLNLWLGNAYCPLAVVIGKGTFRGREIDREGHFSDFHVVTSLKTIHPDSLNAIASSIIPKPVFFLTKDVPLLDTTRPEFLVSFAYEPLHPFVHTIPGMAYAGVISFPVSSAAHEMK